jgi:AcrR family transcriptional regulator
LPERRQALLDAAREVFLERGYANATIDAVVERAGGSKATVYDLFDNKEGLFAALVAEVTEELSGLVKNDAQDGKIEDDLRDFGQRYLQILTRPERLALFRLVIGESGRVPEVGDIFYRAGPQVIFQRVADILRSAASRGQVQIEDVECMAHFFLDALRGHIHLQVLLNPTRRPTPKEIERHVDFVVKTFLHACQ